MDVALLNRKIKVQKNTVVVDAIGNHINEWVDFYSCYATISGESPNLPSDGVKLCPSLRLTNTVSFMPMRFITSLALTTRISRRNP